MLPRQNLRFGTATPWFFLATASRPRGRTARSSKTTHYSDFLDRKVHFKNAGWGGDTAAGGLKRLERDVFERGATVLIVAYGINDIGWGTRADAEHKRIYLESIRGIVERCKERGVRVFIASAAITAENPDTAEHGFLQTMCDEGMALARSLGEHAIDIERTMREIQRKVLAANATSKPSDTVTLHAADGIHLSDLGQLAMAFAILKGLGVAGRGLGCRCGRGRSQGDFGYRLSRDKRKKPRWQWRCRI